MVPEHTTARYRHWYAKLLRFYPKPYRERFGESMEQTFNDLCRERQDAGEGLFGFVLWTFADTVLGIIDEGIKFMTPTVKKYGSVVLYLLMAVSIIAAAWFGKDTQYENAWLLVMTIGFFIIAGFELYSRRNNKDI
jgi:hypothetical protein